MKQTEKDEKKVVNGENEEYRVRWNEVKQVRKEMGTARKSRKKCKRCKTCEKLRGTR